MKIGILTYHRTLNYGACLQAVATRVVLEKMGHKVYYVDYWPKYHASKYKLFSLYKLRCCSWRKKYKYVRDSVKYFSLQKKRILNFETFFKKYIYPYCRSIQEDYDAIIYGSDQIWRKQQEIRAYNPYYFGKNSLKAKQHIAYAASMGILPLEIEDIKVVKELVSHIDAISVREKDLKLFLENIGFKNVYQSLDPTLLLDQSVWDDKISTSRYMGDKYILVYIMGANGFDMRQIQLFAAKKKLKVIYLKGYATTKESTTNIVSAGPSEFIRLIKNAEYVFSSSFHGLAFSIIYKKQVFASFTKNEGRARSLLSALEIEERLLPAKSPIPTGIKDIDYVKVTKKLKEERDNSLNYLIKMLK